jgi:hypothetical protein
VLRHEVSRASVRPSEARLFGIEHRPVFTYAVARHIMQSTLSYADILSTLAYIRQSILVGVTPVTPEQAKANKLAGKSPTKPRAGRPGLVPFSSATLWRKVKAGAFPAPVKLSERVTAWRAADVKAWLEARGQ